MGSEHYCLRWNNHQSNLLGVFSQLLQDESLVDVTLACSEGASIRAHKVVLSACSSYFQSLFLEHPSRHPIVILKDVQFAELRTLVEFMYKGEVNVQYCQLSALLKTAESLKVKGLAEMTNLNSAADTTEMGGSEVDPLQPQDLTPTRAAPEQQAPERLVREDSSPPRASPLMHVRRPRHEFRYESRQELRHEPRQEIKQETRQETRHEARHEEEHEPGGGHDVKHEVVMGETKHEMKHEMKQEPHHEQTTRDPGGKEEPPDEPMWTSSPEDDISSIHSNCGHSDNLGLNMSINMNNNTPTLLTPNPLELRLGLGGLRSMGGEPIAGPSGLPPVQQVPLSLKKEVDWNRIADDKSVGESSSEYRHPLHESMAIDSSPGSSRSGTPLGGWPAALLALLQRRALHLLPPPAPPLHRPFRPLDESPLGSLAPHRCPACLAAFPSPWLLERHAALQHPPGPEDKPFVCEQCGQSYRYRSAYAKHREQNHRARLPADKLFTCDVCGMQFRYLKSFKKHRLNHALERLHGARDRADRVSSTDDALVPRSGELDLSIRGPSSITDPEDSDAEFRRARSEDAEDETVDESATPEAEKSPEERTETSFANVSSLADSSVGEASSSGGMRVEVAPDAALLGYLNPERQRERRFACPFCGKCVRSKENLKLHVRKHTGERPFVCLFCGRAFGGKSDLTRHLRIHTGERPYHCEACGKCFARADYLSKHLTTHIHNPR